MCFKSGKIPFQCKIIFYDAIKSMMLEIFLLVDIKIVLYNNLSHSELMKFIQLTKIILLKKSNFTS